MSSYALRPLSVFLKNPWDTILDARALQYLNHFLSKGLSLPHPHLFYGLQVIHMLWVMACQGIQQLIVAYEAWLQFKVFGF